MSDKNPAIDSGFHKNRYAVDRTDSRIMKPDPTDPFIILYVVQ